MTEVMMTITMARTTTSTTGVQKLRKKEGNIGLKMLKHERYHQD